MHRTILHEGETRTLGVGAQVIKEQAANTTAFPSVLDVKVLVAPCLVGLIVGHIVAVTYRFVNLMEMNGILLKKIGRRQVGASTEPPAALRCALTSLEIAVVCVDGWGHGVVRMEHKAEPCRKEIQVRSSQVVTSSHLGGSLWTQGSVNDAHVHAGFLKDMTVGKHPAATTTALLTFPPVFSIGRTVMGGNRFTNDVLEAMDHVDHGLPHADSPVIKRSTASTQSICAPGANPWPRLNTWPGA